MIPQELIQRFFALYLKVKSGDVPDTFAEIVDALQLVLDVAKFIGGSVSTMSAISTEEAEAVVQAWANGDAQVAADARFPALRELVRFALPLLLELLKGKIGG